MGIPTGGPGHQQTSPEVPLEGGAQYTFNLTNEADTNAVASGPGGSSVVVDRVLISDPAQAGVRGNERGSDSTVAGLATSDISLQEPANYQASYDFGPFFTALVTIGEEQAADVIEEPAEELSELDRELAELADDGPSVFSYSPTYDEYAVEEFSAGGPQNEEDVEGSGEGGSGPPPPDLTSTDPAAVLSALVAFSGVDTDPTITADQKATVLAALTKLASTIAQQNVDGVADPGLKSWNPAVVSQTLKNISAQANVDLQGASLDLVNTYLGSAGNVISAENVLSGVAPPIDSTFTALNSSTDKTVIYNELLDNVDISQFPENKRAALVAALHTLSERIAAANSSGSPVPGIESPEHDTIVEALSNLLGLEDDISLSADQKQALRSLLSTLANNIAITNERKWTEDSHSTDANVVFISLKKLSNISYDKTLTAEERSIGEDYLKVLSAALAFLSTMRATIARLDAELEKNISKAKLDNVEEQTNVARTNYTTACEALDTELRKIEESKKQAEIMKIVMPIVTALMAIVSVIVTIVTLGVAAPAVCAAMCIMIVAMTAVMITLECTDALEKMCEHFNITDPVQKAGVKTAVQLAIVAVMIALTLGACAASAPILLGGQAAAMSARVAAETAVHQIATNPMIWTTVAAMTLQSFMSSGLLALGLVAMYKKCGLGDEEAETAAMITAIALMIVIMLAIMIGGQAAKGAATVADEASSFVGARPTGTQGASSLTIGGHRGPTAAVGSAQTATTGATAGVGAGAAAAQQAAEAVANNSAIMQMLRNLANKMVEMLKDPFFYTQLMTAAAQITPQAMKIVHLEQQIALTEIQIELQTQLAQGEALLAYLKQFVPVFDITLEGLQSDAKKMVEFMMGLINLVFQMIQSASKITTELHQKG